MALGGARLERKASWDEIKALASKDEVLLNCVDVETEARMKEVVDEAYKTGDTRGGVFEIVVRGAPVGLGSHIAWDTRLDGRLAQAVVSMQAVKGVEVGGGVPGRGFPRVASAGYDPLQQAGARVLPRLEQGGRTRRGA